MGISDVISPFNQLSPFGGGAGIDLPFYTLDGCEPTLVYDRANEFSGSRLLDEGDYLAETTIRPALVYDRQNSFSGSRPLDENDYLSEGKQPTLVYDRQNSFGGSQ